VRVDELELVEVIVMVLMVVVVVVAGVVVAAVELVRALELVDELVLDAVVVVRVDVVGLQVPHRTGQSVCIRSRIGAMLLLQRCVKSTFVRWQPCKSGAPLHRTVVVVVVVELVHTPHNAGHRLTASSRTNLFALVQASLLLNTGLLQTLASSMPLQKPIVVVVSVVTVVVLSVVVLTVVVVVVVSVMVVSVVVIVDAVVVEAVVVVVTVVVVDVVVTHVPQRTGQLATKCAASFAVPFETSQNPGRTPEHESTGSKSALPLSVRTL
jgi:hypothetical protein